MHMTGRLLLSFSLLFGLSFIGLSGCFFNDDDEWVTIDEPLLPPPPSAQNIECQIVECRSGYHCVEDGPRKGECVSLCNPRCMAPTSCVQCGEEWDCKTSEQKQLCDTPPSEGRPSNRERSPYYRPPGLEDEDI